MGGTTAAARNVISANQWGIRLDGSTATGNLIEGNDIGTDSSGTVALGNEINGIIISNSASGNSIGGTISGGGQHDRLQRGSGCFGSVGDRRLDPFEQHLFQWPSRHQPGCAWRPSERRDAERPGVRVGPNDLQNTPVMTAVVAGTNGSAQATLNSLPNTPFLIQFFTNITPDSSDVRSGTDASGIAAVVTNASGNAMASVTPAAAHRREGSWVTHTATNLVDRRHLGICRRISTAQPVSVQFEMTQYSVLSSVSTATIGVERVGNVSALVTVEYATSNGTAIAGKQYLPASGTLDVSSRPVVFRADVSGDDPSQPGPVGGHDDGQSDAERPGGTGRHSARSATPTLSISELPAPRPRPAALIALVARLPSK